MYKSLKINLGVVFSLICVASRKQIEMNGLNEKDTCAVLASRLHDLEQELRNLKDEHATEIDDLKKEMQRQVEEKTVPFQFEKEKLVAPELQEVITGHENNGTVRNQRYLLETVDTPVGFTAYMDHSVHLGIDQTVVFNHVLFNDGGAYNAQTGIFSCPVDGVYLFFFEVGAWHQQIVAKLVC